MELESASPCRVRLDPLKEKFGKCIDEINRKLYILIIYIIYGKLFTAYYKRYENKYAGINKSPRCEQGFLVVKS